MFSLWLNSHPAKLKNRTTFKQEESTRTLTFWNTWRSLLFIVFVCRLAALGPVNTSGGNHGSLPSGRDTHENLDVTPSGLYLSKMVDCPISKICFLASLRPCRKGHAKNIRPSTNCLSTPCSCIVRLFQISTDSRKTVCLVSHMFVIAWVFSKNHSCEQLTNITTFSCNFWGEF